MDNQTKPNTEAQSDRTRVPPSGTNGSGPAQPGFEQLFKHIAELREFASHFVQAKLDAAKASLKTAVLYAALGVVGAVVAGTVLVTSAVLLTTGLAGAIGAILHIPWLGNLIVGVVLIGLFVSAMWFGISSALKSSKAKTRSVYATRATRQRSQFGEDVHQSAGRANPTSETKTH